MIDSYITHPQPSPLASVDVPSQAMVLFLLIHCLLVLPLFILCWSLFFRTFIGALIVYFVLVLVFLEQYLVSSSVLQASG